MSQPTNSYLQLAIGVLRVVRLPLTAKQIISEGQSRGLMPSHLRGKTQYKTLNARISEHIQSSRDKAVIYRTAPSTYFLSEFDDDDRIPAILKRRYRGFLRRKQVRNERVLVCPASFLDETGVTGFVPFRFEWFNLHFATTFDFVERKAAEKRHDIKQFVSYTILIKDNSVLTYRRGKFNTAEDDIKGARSVGFGGHISDVDFDIFSNNAHGIYNNICRELTEELSLKYSDVSEAVSERQLRIVGILNLNETEEALKHLAVISIYALPTGFDVAKNEMSINDLRWLDLGIRLNDLSAYELWSRRILEMHLSGDAKFRMDVA